MKRYRLFFGFIVSFLIICSCTEDRVNDDLLDVYETMEIDMNLYKRLLHDDKFIESCFAYQEVKSYLFSQLDTLKCRDVFCVMFDKLQDYSKQVDCKNIVDYIIYYWHTQDLASRCSFDPSAWGQVDDRILMQASDIMKNWEDLWVILKQIELTVSLHCDKMVVRNDFYMMLVRKMYDSEASLFKRMALEDEYLTTWQMYSSPDNLYNLLTEYVSAYRMCDFIIRFKDIVYNYYLSGVWMKYINTGELPPRPVIEGIRVVTIFVKASTNGTTLVVPGEGCRDEYYRVPLYQLIVDGIDEFGFPMMASFLAVRFGVKKDAEGTVSVVGLGGAQTYVIRDFFPDKYSGGSLEPGAWHITGNYLIHDGVNGSNQAFAAHGCIELYGKGQFGEFNRTLLRYSGASSERELANSGKLKIIFQACIIPPVNVK